MAGAAMTASRRQCAEEPRFPLSSSVATAPGFAVPSADAALARRALAETATWVNRRPRSEPPHRNGFGRRHPARGNDVRVARYVPSDNISIAMFSGGGLAPGPMPQ